MQRMQITGSSSRDRGPTYRDMRHPQDSDPVRNGLRSPELRIVRKVNYGNIEEKKAWNDYLDDLGEKNYGKGEPRRLSNMGCTLVTATTINMGFQDKYGKDIFQDRRTVIQRMRELAKRFNQHAKGEDRWGFGFMLEVTLSEVDSEFSDSRAAKPDEQTQNPYQQFLTGWSEEERLAILERQQVDEGHPRILWAPARYAVNQVLEKVGHYKYAVGLDTNNQIHTERQEVVDYLVHEEGFNPSVIDRNNQRFYPHMTVFMAYGNSTIDTDLPPPNISFHPPRAIVNINT